MAVQDSRILIKRSTNAGELPTIPLSDDHLDGSWLNTDIYEGEFFYNVPDQKLYQRSGASIVLIGSQGATVSGYKVNAVSITPPPLSGYVIYNNATQASATEISFHYENSAGQDISEYLLNYLGVASSPMLHLTGANQGDFQQWLIIGITDNTTYVTYDVILLYSSTSFADDLQINVSIENKITYTPLDIAGSNAMASDLDMDGHSIDNVTEVNVEEDGFVGHFDGSVYARHYAKSTNTAFGPNWNQILTYVIGGGSHTNPDNLSGIYQSPTQTTVYAKDASSFARLDVNKAKGVGVNTDTYYGYAKTSNLTGEREYEEPDLNGTRALLENSLDEFAEAQSEVSLGGNSLTKVDSIKDDLEVLAIGVAGRGLYDSGGNLIIDFSQVVNGVALINSIGKFSHISAEDVTGDRAHKLPDFDFDFNQLVRTKITNISAAQVSALFTTPINVLPTPASGFKNNVLNIKVRHNFLTAAYATNVTLTFRYQGAGMVFAQNAAILTSTTIREGEVVTTAIAGASNTQVLANAALQVAIAAGNPTAGGGSLDVIVTYNVIPA